MTEIRNVEQELARFNLRLLAAEGTGFDPQWEKKSAY